MKKLLYLIFIGVSLLLVLNSCGGGGSSSSGVTEPQIEVTYPESGEIIAKAVQTNGTAYMDYYGSSINEAPSKILSKINEDRFEFKFDTGNPSEFLMDPYKIKYFTNDNESINLKLYVNDVLEFEDSNAMLRALSEEEECKVSRQAIGFAFLHLLQTVEFWQEKKLEDMNLTKALVVMIENFPNLKVAFERYENTCTKTVENASSSISSDGSSSSSPSQLYDTMKNYDIRGLANDMIKDLENLYDEQNICPSTGPSGVNEDPEYTVPTGTVTCDYEMDTENPRYLQYVWVNKSDIQCTFAFHTQGKLRLISCDFPDKDFGIKGSLNENGEYISLSTMVLSTYRNNYSIAISSTSSAYYYRYFGFSGGQSSDYYVSYKEDGSFIDFCTTSYDENGNFIISCL